MWALFDFYVVILFFVFLFLCVLYWNIFVENGKLSGNPQMVIEFL